ncbi:MAG: biopolymer transporter ExbD [Ignavibacteria bacterium]|nr:biopolymer transporter ExbD [Ignavibacteria bacterium]
MAGGGFDAPETGGGRGKKKKSKVKTGVHIDMTPMVDVIMLLLTFFILTTTLSAPQVMQINLPRGKEEDKVKVDMGNVLFIRVSDKGNIYFSKGNSDGTEQRPELIVFEKMKPKLEQIYNANNDLMILLKFDRKMKYEKMIDVLDEINRSKIERRYTFLPMEQPDKDIVISAGG